jgi:hypothetical protein
MNLLTLVRHGQEAELEPGSVPPTKITAYSSTPWPPRGCLKIYNDTAIGTTSDRPEWTACLADLRPDDTLIICRIHRLGRKVRGSRVRSASASWPGGPLL